MLDFAEAGGLVDVLVSSEGALGWCRGLLLRGLIEAAMVSRDMVIVYDLNKKNIGSEIEENAEWRVSGE